MVRLSIVAALYAAVANAVDFDKIAVGKGHSRLPGAYIFEFEENHDCADFFAKASARGRTRMQYNYKLFKGASIQFTDIDNAEDLASEMALLPGIKQKWPVQTFSIPKPEVHWTGTPGMEYKSIQKRGFEERDSVNDTFSPHVMTQIDKLRAEGVTGKGLKVALVDSGVDYKHPALGGCFGKDCLVSFGTDLVGDAYDGLNHAKPDNDPMDCAGHGTHVAGILAAQKNTMGFTGAAPGVQIGAYRAFGCNGEAGNDVLIAAFNQAFEDGADIISASIGGPSGWSEEPWAVAVSRIVEQGVPCVLAAGNAGAMGMFYASTAANGKKVTAVGSFDNTKSLALLNASKYSIGGGPEHEFGHLSGKPSAWKDVKLPLWALNYDTSVADDGCDEWPKNTPDLSKYIVLLRRGSCTFDAKAANAVKAGAKYIIFYSNKEDLAPFDVSSVAGIKAASIVSPEQGADWIASLKAKKKITLSMSDGSDGNVILEQKHNNVTAGAASTFSSWGPTWEMDVKPQFGAPGGKILSTYPRSMGSYAVLSGTSMASPLVAGIVALIAEARGTRDPALIENLLSASANPRLFNDGKIFYDFLAPVPQQGGGIVQAHDAAHAKVLLSRSSLSFNDTDHFAESLNFTVKNTGKKQIDLQISHVPAVTMFTLVENYIYPDEFPNDFAKEHASLKFSESKVTINAGESIVIEVLATPPKGLNATRLPVWSGYVTINGTDGTSLSLPYQGLTGSLHDSIVLGPKDTWIANSTDENRFPVADNTTWTLPKPGTANNLTDTLPGLTWFLALGSAKLHAEIMPVTTEKPTSSKKPRVIGEPVDFPLLWNAMGTNSQAFTGELADGTFAPAGQYVVRYRALRIFGDEKKEEDWDEAYSPVFTIRYEK
ncbi:putative subtilisin-like serine protease [Fusarium proliferatum ET1]|uniref:Probable subtilisin-like serine protease n=1 Tax=Fusarium proliferatum (strain ET1) TaxID=1227346 RepID=A0A1L7VJ24_FUSPR|nr:putative subtilisin-like serine protease [Fusarium proliferatum ET1]CZR40312.1 probable subtilisin-like serine protease [Fusarium proliferatum ET1]